MASDVPSHVRFDFEDEMPDVNGTQPSGGSVGNPQPAVVPNPDANMADVEGGADPFDDHGFVDMQEFGRVTARVAALERTLHTVNTNLTSMSTLFNQFMSRFASVSGSVPSGGTTLVVMPPLVPTPPIESIAPSSNTRRGYVEKHEAACVQGGGA